jgi:hypothetical protein
MTFNLGGSTLRIRDNGLSGYSVINIAEDKSFIRVTNGIVQGDKDNHNYNNGTTNEWGDGVSVIGSNSFITIDNLEVFNTTGDCIATANYPNYLSGFDVQHWVSGSISTSDGSLVTDNTKIRLVANQDLTKNSQIAQYGYFNITGDGWGNFGAEMASDMYDVYFYDTNSVFISVTSDVKTFDEIYPPVGARYFNLVLHQSVVPDVASNSSNCVISIGRCRTPRFIFIEKNYLHDSRRTGLVTPGKHIYICKNRIRAIHGTGPGAIIDVEDGYGLNQSIYFEDNHCEDAKVGLSFVSTRKVHVHNNYLKNCGSTTVWGACRDVHMSKNTFINSGGDLQGDTIFVNNTVKDCTFRLASSGFTIVTANRFYGGGITMDKDTPYTLIVDGNHFYSGIQTINTTTSVGQSCLVEFTNVPQTFTNNVISGTLQIVSSSSNLPWTLSGNTFANTGEIPYLPYGYYTNCTFDNVSGIQQFRGGTDGNSFIEFIDCKFLNFTTPQFTTNTTSGTIPNYKFKDCEFRTNRAVASIYVSTNTTSIEVESCQFIYSGISSNFNIVDIYNYSTMVTKLHVKYCKFTSNFSIQALDLANQDSTTDNVFTDNTLENVYQTLTASYMYTQNNKVNGIYNYYGQSVAVPSSGVYRIGDRITNSHPNAGGYQGWVCTYGGAIITVIRQGGVFYNVGNLISMGNGYIAECIQGGYTRNGSPTWSTVIGTVIPDNVGFVTWTPNTAYTTNTYVLPTVENGYYYWVTQAGTTGATEPDWTASTITDGTIGHYAKEGAVKWQVYDIQPQFRGYGLISATQPDTAPPANVTALASSLPATGQVTLTWTNPTDSDFLYDNIYYKLSTDSTWTKANTKDISSTTFTITGLTSGSSYNFKVTSLDVNNNESVGATITTTPS